MTTANFDFDRPVHRTRPGSFKWDKFPARVLAMGVADMDFQTSPQIIRALGDEVERGIFGYATPSTGLRETVLQRLAQNYGWSIDPDWIVWMAGVVPGLAACCRIAGKPGDEIITNPPIYHHFLGVIPQAGRERVDVPLQLIDGRWSYDFDAIRDAITPRTRMILLCSPHNPVGTVFTGDELAKLVQLCAQRGVLIISDEIHCDLVLDKHLKHIPTAMACSDYQHGIITLMAPSKTFNLAGVNCSFAIIPDAKLRLQFKESILRVAPMVSGLAYAAALAAYRDSGDWHAALLEYLRGNRDLLEAEIAQIPQLSMPHVAATYLGWLDTRRLGTGEVANAMFREHGIGFSCGSEFGDRHFQRINFACTRENLIESITRIKATVEDCD
jgi:cystathionine beta-lyase